MEEMILDAPQEIVEIVEACRNTVGGVATMTIEFEIMRIIVGTPNTVGGALGEAATLSWTRSPGLPTVVLTTNQEALSLERRGQEVPTWSQGTTPRGEEQEVARTLSIDRTVTTPTTGELDPFRTERQPKETIEFFVLRLARGFVIINFIEARRLGTDVVAQIQGPMVVGTSDEMQPVISTL